MDSRWTGSPGVALLGHGLPGSAVDWARDAERAGFGSVWLIEDYYHPGAFALAGAVAAATARIGIGLGVVNPSTRHPAPVAMETAALAGLDRDTHLHVSFDVDFLDPDIAPGVGTTVPGGPSYREAQLCMEMVADTGLLRSLDLMELNPALDVHNRSAEVTVDLVGSLFGKSTLMRRAADA